VFPTWIHRLDTVTVSPKPPSSGNVTAPDLPTLVQFASAIRQRGVPSSLKVVVFDDEDYEYAKSIHAAFPTTPLTLQVGTDQTPDPYIATHILDSLRELQAKALADPDMVDVKVLPQLHSILYGLKRGI
jgi:7-carboxy-7-deazaguanine synthase